MNSDKILKNFKEKQEENTKAVTANTNKNQYDEKLQEYNIGIIDNIRFAFDSTTEYLSELAKDFDNMRNYKMFILCLDNSLELLFKFMIFNRNEFLLYLDEKRENIYNKYKKAKDNNYQNLSIYFEDNPFENDLHTISFSEACKVLCYVCQIDEFDNLFYKRCMELSKARNSLTHYSGIIRKIDLISFCNLLDTAIAWFNNEIQEYYTNKFCFSNNGIKHYCEESYICKQDFCDDIRRVCQETIETEILEDELCRRIIGYIIENSYGELLDVSIKDYKKIENLFFGSDKIGIPQNKEMHLKFMEKYYMMNLADMICDRGVKAWHSEDAPEVMGRLDLKDWMYELLKKKWTDVEDQKKKLNITKSIYEVYNMDNCEWDEY